MQDELWYLGHDEIMQATMDEQSQIAYWANQENIPYKQIQDMMWEYPEQVLWVRIYLTNFEGNRFMDPFSLAPTSKSRWAAFRLERIAGSPPFVLLFGRYGVQLMDSGIETSKARNSLRSSTDKLEEVRVAVEGVEWREAGSAEGVVSNIARIVGVEV